MCRVCAYRDVLLLYTNSSSEQWRVADKINNVHHAFDLSVVNCSSADERREGAKTTPRAIVYKRRCRNAMATQTSQRSTSTPAAAIRAIYIQQRL